MFRTWADRVEQNRRWTLVLLLCWGPRYPLPWYSWLCAPRCRIHIPLCTKSLIPGFLVAVVPSSLSYHGKGCSLFVNFCTLWLFTSDLYLLKKIIPFFETTLKINPLSQPVFPFPSLKCIVTLRQILYFQNQFTNIHFSLVIFLSISSKFKKYVCVHLYIKVYIFWNWL